MRSILLKWTVLLGLALLAASVLPQRAAADHDDPPGRVARLGYVSGAIAFQPAGTGDWISASVNRPLTTGDKLWSDRNSRAELHLGSAAIRLDDNTGIALLNLGDQLTQLRMSAGTIYVRVWRIDEDEDFEIDTPDIVVNITQPGVYRIHVSEAGDRTEVTVRRGHADITGGGQEFGMRRGETAMFTSLDEDQVAVDFVGSPDYDDFEDWCAARDRRERLAESSRYVSRDVIGYEDLDEYGGWRDLPDYGRVWFPHTRVIGWVPYRFGHWVWIWPWGWTWMDDEPWGFAPFHYGRWVVVRGVWGWVPPPARRENRIYVRPVYAPALVAWISNRRVGIYLHLGARPAMDVAWVPLAPREVYVPSYRVSQTYVNNVNITNTTVTNVNITNVYNNYTVNRTVNNVTYVHQTAPGAVTATSQAVFTSAQPVGRNLAYIPRQSPRVPVETTAAPPFVPREKSVLGAAPVAPVRPPAVLQNRPVVAKTPPPDMVPFLRQQQEAQARGGGAQPVPPQRPGPPARVEQPERPPLPPPVRILPRVMPRAPQEGREGRPGDVRPPATPVAPMPPVSPEGAGARQARPPVMPPTQPPLAPAPPPAAPPAPARPPVTPQERQERPDRPAMPPAQAPVVPAPPPAAPPVPARPPAAPQERQERPDRPAMPPAQPPVAPAPPPAAPPTPARPPVAPQERQDRPPAAPRPVRPTVTPLDEQHQEEVEKLRRQQDLERQRIEQQQVREQKQIQQQKANEMRQRQIQEQQQRRLEELERQHGRQEQELRKRQQEQPRQPERAEKPPKSEKPEKEAKPPKTEKPPAPKPPAEHPQPRSREKDQNPGAAGR